MSSSQRSPKELRDMVSESQMDLQEMQDSLAKLKGLKADDKSEMGMLRSRIEDQSRLIMILKQRSDEEVIRNQTLEKINKDLEDFRDHADDMLKHEQRKFDQLDHRFHTLANNHEEMIKFKDEYKRVNVELREENARLRSENARLFSKAIQEKDARIQDLEKKFVTMKMENSNLEMKFKKDQEEWKSKELILTTSLKHRLNDVIQMQQEWRVKEDGLRQQLHDVTENTAAQIRDLQHKAQQAEERLKGAQNKLQNQDDSRKTLEQDYHGKLSTLTKERDELLDLAMQRGKLIQKEQSENKRLQKKIEDTEKDMLTMQAKFDRDASSVNANLQVRKLKEELSESQAQYDDLTKEFGAYKKHTSNLLKQEKELNERLRHLAG